VLSSANIDVDHEITVGDVMTTALAAVPAWMSMRDARKIAALKCVDHLVVEEEGRLIGLLAGADLAGAPDDEPAGAWMIHPANSMAPTASALRARHIMLKHGVACLAVLAGSLLIGIVTRDAVERALAGRRH